MLERLSGFISKDTVAETIENPQGELMAKWGNAFSLLVGDKKTKYVPATPTNAVRFASVYACINTLGDDIAKLPLKSYIRGENGTTRDKDSDVAKVLGERPNRFMTPFIWKKLVMTDALTAGNHYSYIHFDMEGKIDELIPLDPYSTQVIVDRKTRAYGYRTTFNGAIVDLLPHEVFHMKSLSTDGIIGISPIEAIKLQMETMGLGLQYNKDLIERGATPQGILEVDSEIGKEAKEKVKEEWERVNSSQKIAITDLGMKYRQIGISQVDMQYIDTYKMSQQQIASIYKMPLHKINDLSNATYTNIEQQSLDYVKNTLQPWVTQFEEEADYKFYTRLQRNQRHYCKFNMDSELRGDSKSRAEVQKINVWNGFKTVNEVRIENEDNIYADIEEANQPMMTLNVVPLKNVSRYQKNKFGQSLKGGDDENDNGDGEKDTASGDGTP